MIADRVAKSLQKQAATGIEKFLEINGTPVAQVKSSFVDAVLL